MARDFHDTFACARAVFDEASTALAMDVAALCFEPNDRLSLTQFAQPAILTAEIAMARSLEEHFGFHADCFGGHSLGEYAALVAAGVIELAAAVRLVHERGRLMQAAVPVGTGGMRAIVQPGLDADRLAAAVAEVGVDVANYNSPDQVVISGSNDALNAAAERVHAIEGHERARVIALKVSAPFHSRWMAAAEEHFRPTLEHAGPAWQAQPAERVTCNFTGTFHRSDRAALVEALTRQIGAPVRWLENMTALHQRCSRIVEIGPGRPLRAFFASLGVSVDPVTTVAAAENVFG